MKRRAVTNTTLTAVRVVLVTKSVTKKQKINAEKSALKTEKLVLKI